ncbi:MAG TPA: hypothetical protein VKT28_18755 [Puia sp.]|nr:hypothetical protein [Puia sp.]
MKKCCWIIKTFFILFFITHFLIGCNNTQNASESVLSCILLGYDSIAIYQGNSSKMSGLERGKLNDSVFVNQIIKFAKEQSGNLNFKVAIKPTASGDVGTNLKKLVDLLNKNNIQNRSIDTLDDIEEKKFGIESLQKYLSPQPLNLYLPKDDSHEPKIDQSILKDAITVITFENEGIYAYSGTNIKSGEKYTYNQFRKFLLDKKSRGDIYVIIKPSKSCTYKNTVNMLDEMTIDNIKKYALVDLTKDEEKYLEELKLKE